MSMCCWEDRNLTEIDVPQMQQSLKKGTFAEQTSALMAPNNLVEMWRKHHILP